jgi:hypothetical protein
MKTVKRKATKIITRTVTETVTNEETGEEEELEKEVEEEVETEVGYRIYLRLSVSDARFDFYVGSGSGSRISGQCGSGIMIQA